MPSHSFTLNGERVTVEAPADMPLLWVLRDLLNVTGPKYGCGVGACRACTSHLDGDEIQPCVVPVADCAGRKVTTIEGLADGDKLHPVQQAWLDCDVAQCGFCQPGHGRPPEEDTPADGRRHRPDRERLPLRHLLPDPRSDQQGRRR